MSGSAAAAQKLEASELRAYRVSVSFDVQGTPFGIGDDLRRFDPSEDDADDAPLRLAIEAEAAAALKPICDVIQLIGGISAGPDPNGAAPLYVIVTAAASEPPLAPLPWLPVGDAGELEPLLGSMRDRPLSACAGIKFNACAWAKSIPLDRAYALLCERGPTHELSCWGGECTPDRMPKDAESVQQWAARNAVPADYMTKLTARLIEFDQDLVAYDMPPPTANVAPKFVWDGVLALGDVAVLAARSKAGKTTFAHQLLAIAAAPTVEGVRKTFLGREVPGMFYAAVLNAEESDWHFLNRQRRLERLWPGGCIIRPKVTRSDWRERLEWLAQFAERARAQNGRLGILKIDSIQAFIGGDDSKSNVASEFQQTLREWAVRTGWAVLALHHTTKFPARNLANFRDSIRGSSVHVDLPRITLALIRRGAGLVEFGTVACNLPREYTWLDEGEGVLCEEEPDTCTFGLAVAGGPSADAATGDDIDRVASAIAQLNSAGRIVQRTGSDGLYEQRLPTLAGLSRRFIQQAINSLVEAGRVELTKRGLIYNDAMEPDHTIG